MNTDNLFCGKAYILVNVEANRVKIGITINDVEERLIDVNRKWKGRSATCQICGSRLLLKRDGNMQKHLISGVPCSGGSFLPLEKDSSLAQYHLEKMRENHKNLKGSEMGSNTKRIKTLEARIERYKKFGKPVGRWKIDTFYSTNHADKVEQEAHKVLSCYLNVEATYR